MTLHPYDANPFAGSRTPEPYLSSWNTWTCACHAELYPDDRFSITVHCTGEVIHHWRLNKAERRYVFIRSEEREAIDG